MTTQQGLRQASFRAIGSTAGTYNGDARAAFEAEATIPAGATYNEAFILWLQARLSSVDTNLNNLLAAFAAAESADNWAAVGSFDPASGEAVISDLNPLRWFKFDDGSGTQLTDYSGNAGHGTLGTTTAAPTWVAEGLSFDGGDWVTLGTLGIVRGIDVVFKPDAAISAATSQGKLLGFGNGAGIGDSGVAFGAFFTILTNEIFGIKQQTTDGFAAQAGRAYAHATENITAAWHLAQLDLISAQWTVTIDGTDKSNHQGANAPVAFHSGPWAVASNASLNGQNFTGDIAYVVLYTTARSTAQQAEVRTALTTIMADRGITLP